MKGTATRRVFAVALAMLFVLAVALPAMAATSKVYATTNVNVRKGPGTKYAILGYLTTNEVATKTGTSGKWTKISYNGATAYVSSSYLRAYKGTDSGAVTSGASVANTTTPVYSGPGSSYAQLGTLTSGQSATVVGTVGSYSIINWGTGTGYVYSSYLSASGTSAAASTVVATTTVYVRSGPDSSYSTLGYLTTGQAVTKTGTYGSWTQISYNGQTGYVQSAYLTAYTGSTSGTSGTIIYALTTARVYTGPSTAYSSFGELSKGDSITYLGSTNTGWYQVQLGSRQGYVNAAYFTSPTTGTVSSVTGTVYATSTAPVYSSAGTGATILGYLYQGQSATRTGIVGSWTQISYGGTTGYVNTSLLSVSTSSSGTSGFTTLNTWMYSLTNYNYCYSVPTALSTYQTGYLSQGETVWANATNGTWLQIVVDNVFGSSSTVMYVPASTMGYYGGTTNTSTNMTYPAGSPVWLRTRYVNEPAYKDTSRTSVAGYIPSYTTSLTVTSQVGNMICVTWYDNGSYIGYLDVSKVSSTYNTW